MEVLKIQVKNKKKCSLGLMTICTGKHTMETLFLSRLHRWLWWFPLCIPFPLYISFNLLISMQNSAAKIIHFPMFRPSSTFFIMLSHFFPCPFYKLIASYLLTIFHNISFYSSNSKYPSRSFCFLQLQLQLNQTNSCLVVQWFKY